MSRAGAITQTGRTWRPRASTHRHIDTASVLIFTSQKHRYILFTPFTLRRTHTLVLQACCPISQTIKVRSDRHVLPRSRPSPTLPKKKVVGGECPRTVTSFFTSFLLSFSSHLHLSFHLLVLLLHRGESFFSALPGGRSLRRVSQMNQ